MKKQLPFRHGEIVLLPVNKVPEGKITEHQSYIVGHSETGHHHILESTQKFQLTEADKELYFTLFAPAEFVHKKAIDKHRTLTIPAGFYKRYHDTEYNPFDKVISDVRD